MTKVVIIGAGSGFGGRLSIDIMSRETLRDATICLCDIHPGRLKQVTDYVERTARHYDLPTKVIASTDRRELLPGADFVITSISAGGGAYHGHPFREEIEIPRKYGIEQCIADTVSVGAVFRFLRTGPVQQQILRDVEELCPDAYVLNHTNPMAMLIWLHSLASPDLKVVGLCHGVQGTSIRLAKLLDVPYEELSFLCAGINHLAWFLELRRGREDLYPKLRQLADDPEVFAQDAVRFELMKHFGYFPTESSRHDSEYVPYFRKNPNLMAKFGLEIKEVSDTTTRIREWMKDTGVEDDQDAPVGQLRRSREYTTGIMEAILTDEPFRFNGNVMNTGLIDNLPEGCCVEVPCMVDAQGVYPCWVGALPPQLAAIDRSNVAVQELAVKAVMEKDREAAFHACALDPLAASILPLDQIRSMFEELWEAEKELLLWFDPSHTGPVPEICAD